MLRNRFFKIFLLFVVLLFSATGKAGATGIYQVKISDDAKLLSSSEQTSLKEDMQKLSEYCNVLFITSDAVSFGTADLAKTSYQSCFGVEPGVVFLIDMHNREIFIYAQDQAYKVINKNNAYIITDNVYKYASAGLYYKCSSEAFQQMYSLFEGERINRPMKHMGNILLAIVLSILINYMIMRKTSIAKAVSKSELLSGTSFDFNMLDKDFRLIKSERIKVNDSSSSSGERFSGGGFSGGGFSGGGGGSFGGGGGHKF